MMQVLTDDQYVSDFFEEVVKNRDSKLVVIDKQNYFLI